MRDRKKKKNNRIFHAIFILYIRIKILKQINNPYLLIPIVGTMVLSEGTNYKRIHHLLYAN